MTTLQKHVQKRRGVEISDLESGGQNPTPSPTRTLTWGSPRVGPMTIVATPDLQTLVHLDKVNPQQWILFFLGHAASDIWKLDGFIRWARITGAVCDSSPLTGFWGLGSTDNRECSQQEDWVSSLHFLLFTVNQMRSLSHRRPWKHSCCLCCSSCKIIRESRNQNRQRYVSPTSTVRWGLNQWGSSLCCMVSLDHFTTKRNSKGCLLTYHASRSPPKVHLNLIFCFVLFNNKHIRITNQSKSESTWIKISGINKHCSLFDMTLQRVTSSNKTGKATFDLSKFLFLTTNCPDRELFAANGLPLLAQNVPCLSCARYNFFFYQTWIPTARKKSFYGFGPTTFGM